MHIDKGQQGRAMTPAAVFCRWAFGLWVVAGIALAPIPAGSVEVTDLYTAEVPFDPAERDARANAYRAALNDVLIRITGDPAAAESEEFSALFPNPAQFVMQYRPGEEQSLFVSLDGLAIERVLRRAGATVWGSERSLTVIWLAVDWGLGEREIIAADNAQRLPGDARSINRNRLLRERVQAAATRRGIPIVFPLMDTVDLQSIGFSDIWGGFDDQLLEASSRYEAPSVLVGRIRADTNQPPRWTWYLGGSRFAWPGSPEEAVDELADALVGRFAFQGSQSLESIELTITGVESVNDYARVQRYMSNLRVVEKLTASSAAAGRITYFIDIQGGAERLENALQLSSLLERAGSGYAIDAHSSYGSPQPGAIGGGRSPGQRLEYRLLPLANAQAAGNVPGN